MIWVLLAVGLLVMVYSFFVISGENVYRVTYHDPHGNKWEIMVSASSQREALKIAEKAGPEGMQIQSVMEEL